MSLGVLGFLFACTPVRKSIDDQEDTASQSLIKRDTISQEEAYKKGLEHAVEEKLLPIYKDQIKENEKK